MRYQTRLSIVFYSGLLLSGVPGFAQTSGSAGYGGIGDPAVAPGSPSSSYALSGVDQINYYNGLVNVKIPLYTVGGRGGASVRVAPAIQRQWTVVPAGGYYVPQTYTLLRLGFFGLATGMMADWELFDIVQAVTVAANPNACNVNGSLQNTGPYTTYLVYRAADGTETVLRDMKYNGQPQGSSSCPPQAPSADRGRIFQSSDGTDLTFVSDQDIVDSQQTSYPSGVLIKRDGTQYRIALQSPNIGSSVQSIKDRNGNSTSFSEQMLSDGTEVYTAVDPLNRTSTINVTGASPPTTQTLSYPGAGGATRTVSINLSLLQNALAAGESPQTFQALFPELDGSNSTAFTSWVVSSIVLPDGSSYSMQYNSYGEVARLTLPTGGVYVYKYPEAYAGTGDGVIPVTGGGYNLNRRLLERDEYADGVHLSAKVLFSTAAQQTGLDPNNPSRPGIVTTVTFQDGSGNTLRVEKHYFYGNPASTAPDPANPTEFADWWLGLEFRTDILDGSGKVWQSRANVFTQRPCGAGENCWYTPTSDSAPPHDPQLCQVNTTNDAGQTSGLAYQYDQYNNMTDRYEFDYGSAPAAGASCPTSFSGAKRHAHASFLAGAYVSSSVNILGLPSAAVVSDGAGNQISLSNFYYDQQSPADAPGIVGHDSNYGTGFNTRGNLTSLQQWWSYNSSTVTESYTYDIAGNVLTAADPDGNKTTYSYADSNNTYAHPTTITNALNQSESLAYDYWSGKLSTLTNLNGNQTQYSYNDPLSRLTNIRLPNGGNIAYSYPNPTTVVRLQDQNSPGDGALKTQNLFDGLGRNVESDTFESSSQYIATTTTYDALGRVQSTTNPSRPGDSLNYATTYSYDALGRTIKTQMPDGSVSQTSYSGNQTTVTDPAGKQRQYTYDALGRLTAVLEDPSGLKYSTAYSYDLLDNLIKVSQGSQTRSFNYDSLSRLEQVTNPESGTTTYIYDNAGNLLKRTDSRGITTNYVYDQLNRITSISYANEPSGTPAVAYIYDSWTVANSKGRLTMVTDNNVSTINYTSFDAMGHVLASNQMTQGQTYSFSYGYNLAGALTSETYPSGRTINTSYDPANRPVSVQGTLDGQGKPYASGVNYWPHGGLNSFTAGNNVVPVYNYNNRLQMWNMWATIGNNANQFLLNIVSNWGGTNNNGDVYWIQEAYGPAVPLNSLTGLAQNYTYDGVNRLSSVSDSGYSRSFSYDTYGNMWVSANSGVPLGGNTPTSNTFNSKNQISSVNYDLAGNQMLVNGNSMGYDAENRQTSATEPPSLGGGTEQYAYDGAGRRAWKSGPSGTTVYVYDAFGALAAEYSTTSNSSPCATCYLTWDHLGTPRLVTDQNGNVVARHDYLPFGEEISGNTAGRTSQWGSGSDNIANKFTGQYRDAETGEDYFNARYFAGATGRFNSPDPRNAGANLSDPQTWNAYAYVRGNPLNGTDPTGMNRIDMDGLTQIRASSASAMFRDVYDPAWSGGGPPCFACGYGGGNGTRGPVLGDASAQAEAVYEAQLDAGFFAHGGDPGPPSDRKTNPASSTLSVTYQSSEQTATVQVNSRAANILGGQLLHSIGINHEWITTSTGVSVGMGTAQGVPQSDYPGVQTQVVDHTGQIPDSSVTYGNVNPAALNTYLTLGAPTGPWIPGVNDCNTWVNGVVNNSTPHNITLGMYGVPITIGTNVVVYSDGSIHIARGR
jgi:RHS repeat-associated protein